MAVGLNKCKLTVGTFVAWPRHNAASALETEEEDETGMRGTGNVKKSEVAEKSRKSYCRDKGGGHDVEIKVNRE